MKSILALFGFLSLLRLFRRQESGPIGVFSGEIWMAKVVRVVDGDTVWVSAKNGHVRIRLAHIDAPESGQPWSVEATDWLDRVIPPGSEVQLRPIENDPYGRVVADLYTVNRLGRPEAWINYWLVCNGLAWAVPAVKSKEVASAQLAAQMARIGIWTDTYPVPPWDFRARAPLHAEN